MKKILATIILITMLIFAITPAVLAGPFDEPLWPGFSHNDWSHRPVDPGNAPDLMDLLADRVPFLNFE